MQNPTTIFVRKLNALSAILDKAETYAEAKNIRPEALLSARLFPDMYDLSTNVRTVCDLAKNMRARLTQVEAPRFEDNETSFAQLRERIANTVAFLQSATEADFDGAESIDILLKTPMGEIPFKGHSYFDQFSVPNFYFHLTTAYNILRHNGLEIGKMDFMGVPQKP